MVVRLACSSEDERPVVWVWKGRGEVRTGWFAGGCGEGSGEFGEAGSPLAWRL